jgi:signal transduction histidine kinase
MYAQRVTGLVSGRDVPTPSAGETGPVRRTEIADRWTAGVAALQRIAGPQTRPRLSRWAWAADAFLALALAAGTLSGAQNRGDAVRNAWIPQPGQGGIPLPPDAPAPDGIGIRPYMIIDHYPAATTWQLALAVLTALPLIARRRFPLAVFWIVLVSTLVYHRSPGFDSVFTFIACVIAASGAVMYSPHQAAAITSTLAGFALIAIDHDASVPQIRPGLIVFLFLVPLGLAANAIHTWQQRVRNLEAEQEAATRLAVDQERARIAHELHDVVTHNVSVMVVQAGAARKVMDAAPDQAREALLAIESGGRAAMTELRHVMGLLTMTGDGEDSALFAGLAPQPGLDQVPALAERIRATGVQVDLTVTGVPSQPSPGVDLAAYRVVQEALTNTVKHAVGARVRIVIGYTPEAIRVEVSDTGGIPAASAGSGNHRGLVGLRERLAVYGGTLEGGANPLGGYRVLAVIPLEDP